MPSASLLEFCGGAAAVWSQDRSRCAFSKALPALVGYHDHDVCADAGLWASRIEPRDRERFAAFCETLQAQQGWVTCRYRFLPAGSARLVELEERGLRIAAAGEQGVILSRYSLHMAGDCRSLAHKLGNHLQAIRGEVDLLRLCGSVPERSAANISGAIDAVHEIVQQIGKPSS